ncbi:helix-turn-helix domain-containing protein [Lentibacillus cibarius]|uniref:Zinc finger CGNR domain-containing protein n=1 Tax=Lentibacillus cibarius TaxID=2583219 RepID=A0A5S3QIU0_9BACI|nr:helix-turn-helix domain-containing protein [Lentibacillus cibarius]TMN21834.1 hypothetical protein FFL34_06690 [Lentibacillus cibarius]
MTNYLNAKENSLLTKHTDYELSGNAIYASSEEVEYYNPFAQIKDSLLEYILGKNKDYVDADFDLHTLFLNLNYNNPDQIYRFVQHFGLLYNPIFMDKELQESLISEYGIKQLRYRTGIFSHVYSENESLLMSEINNRPIYLKEFQEEIERLRMVIELYMAIQAQDITILSRNTRFMLFLENHYKHPVLNPFQELLQHSKMKANVQAVLANIDGFSVNKRDYTKQQLEEIIESTESVYKNIQQLGLEDLIIEMCIVYLEANIETALKGVSPKISFNDDGSSQQTWVFSGLLPAIYFMIHQDFISGKPFKRCHNPNCNNLFTPKPKHKIHCSNMCQSRAKTARLKLKKKDEALKLYKEGLSIDEIANKIKMERGRVSGWINKYNKDR